MIKMDSYWQSGLVSDPRTKDWLLAANPMIIVVAVAIYLLIVLKIGPEYMEKRKAYDLRQFIAAYNIFQVIINLYIAYTTAKAIVDANYLHIYCQLIDFSDFGPSVQIMQNVYLTLWIKLIDLIETVIFVLRKKNNQISFLHVYHHATTPLLVWMYLKYMPGGMFSYSLVINPGVHAIMYSYYYLSTLGPRIQKYLKPLKQIITTLQMTQFTFLFLHNAQGLLPTCNVPKLTCAITLMNFMINFILFYKFYNQTYKVKPKEK